MGTSCKGVLQVQGKKLVRGKNKKKAFLKKLSPKLPPYVNPSRTPRSKRIKP